MNKAPNAPNPPPSPAPPEHLSARAKALWAAVVPSRAASPGRIVAVQSALEALDRADQAREEIARTGLTTTTRSTGAVHVNPLAKIERDARAQFTKIWVQDLHLHFCQEDARCTG